MTNQHRNVVFRGAMLLSFSKAVLVYSVVCFAAFSVAAQSKVDIDITVQFSSETARGGEEVPFMATVRNIGDAKASDVILISERYGTLNIVSINTNLGKCILGKSTNEDKLRCELGDILPGAAATINGVIKIVDFDAPSDREIIRLPSGMGQSDGRSDLGSFWVSARERDDDEKNNNADLLLKLLPSLNRAPQVKIVTPKDREILIRPNGPQKDFVVNIEASDVDGRVVKVSVNDPAHSPRPVGMDKKGYTFEYEGVVYPALELDEYLRKTPPSERLATPTGKNTYSYTMTDPPYGFNNLSVYATDDGGRVGYGYVTFFVKSDSTIEIVSPKPDQIIAPGSTVTVETISRLKSGRLKEVLIARDGIAVDSQGEPLKMELVSVQGNVYHHRFVLKSISGSDVYSNVRVFLQEDSGGYADADVGFLVRKLPKINVTSFRDGDTLKKAEKIPIKFDIENRGSRDEFTLYIDDKYYSTLYGDSLYWLGPETGTHTIRIVARFAKIELTKSPLITVNVN